MWNELQVYLWSDGAGGIDYEFNGSPGLWNELQVHLWSDGAGGIIDG